uniref:Uncharacterized protein n=1 Tax=Meloidogyne floridensis TaxID=298350 RepID=A0A915P4D3_9BILA
MSSINLFLFSIFILFEVIYSQGCNKHLSACNDGTCCSGLHCKNKLTRNGLQHFCSISPCVGDNGKCQTDDGCCYGMAKNILLF